MLRWSSSIVGTMLFHFLLFAALTPLALADIQFTSPAAGGTLQAGKPITAKWKDSGDGTPLTDLTTYTLFLCAGGNDADSIVSDLEVDEQLGGMALELC